MAAPSPRAKVFSSMAVVVCVGPQIANLHHQYHEEVFAEVG